MQEQETPERSLKTIRALEKLQSEQLSVNAWARAHGYSTQLVHVIINDQRKCLRGQSLQIAKELGMK